MKIGIIGLPNVGKSTLFKALTKKQVDTSNYPFCTIDPNVGVVKVPDERLEKLAKITKTPQVIPTKVEFVDIAGLVKNAHQGEGLGNQFLSHIREVDAIVEVLRDFEDKNVIHVEGSVNPDRDKDIVHLELVMADLQTVEKRLEKVSKEAKRGDKTAIKILNALNALKKVLADGNLASSAELTDEEKILIKDLNLLTLKPVIYVLNTDNVDDNVETCHGVSLQINAKLESELADLQDDELNGYLKELNIQQTGLDKLILASYKILDLITFYTFNKKETRAWTLKGGTRAPQAAGKIHTDFEKNFIRAEVIDWQKLISAGSLQNARDKGLLRIEGKNYVVQDGDMVYFRCA